MSEAPGYEVSSWGRVAGKRARILAHARTHGYHVVCLTRDSQSFNRRVSRLVADAFLGPPPFDDALVAHNNGDKDDNRVSNLRWASALENQADRTRHGTRLCGSKANGAVLSEADIPAIRRRADGGERYADIADNFGVSISTVYLIRKRRTWTHVPEADS
ncbi:hypothetical protein CVT23_09160 [Minwuia thermotolerans]|uniref:HNH nuclease domain-containing protein n=1 Tax=Minwuia thermotolerans TaxID=2056226 RepID=A0A2M9G355_9PROT|nr:hypothetical protein CVT23_09160 [Minwuia thermotolerans]